MTIADVADEATAFSHRSARFEYVAGVKWNNPDEDILRTEVAGYAAS